MVFAMRAESALLSVGSCWLPTGNCRLAHQFFGVYKFNSKHLRGTGREPALAAKGGTLVKHIRRLLHPKRLKGACMPVLAGVILVATAAVGVAERSHARLGLVPPQRQARPTESSPYKRWLNGPVSYIIRTREREAFDKLATGQERNMFIQQFWERRNPIPGSATNNFKEEFYRRVAYADEHFAEGYPGWKSDRGHMYIAYGPPDEIHFLPHAKPHPYADWLYAFIPGLGEHLTFRFEVPAGNDEYRLSSPPWK
jgi:GWxTD domain-containing protein